ncbi:tRNA lysidine(34) synthetase TilS [Vibrio albus]|uniref:tRNA(Ile)-lysidine synthase n=1 Tax=Vibrio albus TaxID=2200953 RepID=A0A2U3BCF5_9VIBR|nr:tRNA lysidine(34) synthetase TilS [Vibrio albus]PWI34457.1 tRNA lysidine(34) synthetase TilS [Vibrio albus]
MLYPHFSSILKRYHSSGCKIVLALSGGVDSRVLLHLLSLFKQDNPQTECLAVHVHHGLSSNADFWAEQCHQWCSDSGLSSVVERVCLNLGSRISIEQEARQQRYLALKKHIQEGDLLLTGQHLSDQTETFLLALKRGSGPKGLSSMPEAASFGKGMLLRPLLSVSREKVVDYAEQHSLSWVEDESNTDTRYDRNFLRQYIVPQLTERWPDIERSVSRSAQLCADQEALLNELLAERLAKMIGADGGISVVSLHSESALARNQLIRMWLDTYSVLMPGRKQLSLIWNEVVCAQPDANPRLTLSQGEIRRYQNRLYWVDKQQDITDWRTEFTLNTPVDLPDRLGSIMLTDRVSENGFKLRAARPEERVWVSFNPEGIVAHPEERAHSRKLKKLFQEYGVPPWLRRRLPLIMYNDCLAGVAGLFVDRDFSGNAVEVVWDRQTQG